MPTDTPEDKPHYLGHRKRLRARFLEGGPEALADYEMLEMLLGYAIPQRDTKPIAKAMLARFGGLNGVMAAEPETLAEFDHVKDHAVALLRLAYGLAQRLAREEVVARPVLGSWNKVLAYCRASMGFEAVEQFRLLFLNRKNALLADVVQQRGTVDQAAVYPREVVRRALAEGASAVIMVHNHPSGDPTPSKADIDITRQVEEALAAVSITLHDHIIITRSDHASFKTLGLL